MPNRSNGPGSVSSQAARAGLGGLVAVHEGGGRITNGLQALGAGLALVGILAAASASGVNVPEAAKALVFIPPFAVALGAIFLGARLLLSGPITYYLYEQGLVLIHRGRVRTVPWSETRELKAHRGRGMLDGQVLGYMLVPSDGKNIFLGADGDADVFARQMTEAVRRAGRPVVA